MHVRKLSSLSTSVGFTIASSNYLDEECDVPQKWVQVSTTRVGQASMALLWSPPASNCLSRRSEGCRVAVKVMRSLYKRYGGGEREIALKELQESVVRPKLTLRDNGSFGLGRAARIEERCSRGKSYEPRMSCSWSNCQKGQRELGSLHALVW